MRFPKWLCAGLCLLSFFAKSEPLYWQATKGNTTFMLMGTIHVGAQSMYPLPTSVLNFLKTSDGLIVEADLSTDNNIQLPPTNLTTRDVLDSPQKKQLEQIARDLNMSNDVLMRLAPWLSALKLQIGQVQQLGYESDLGIDQYLISQAQQFDRSIIALETLQFQIDALSSFEQDGAELLISTLDSWDEANEMIPCLFESWATGHLPSLATITQESELPAQINSTLNKERNYDWIDKLTNGHWLPNPQGRYLVAVGALHFVGNDNLIDLFIEKGFTVKQLNHSRIPSCSTE
ncbi:TraB/GumN family protein [Vibrio sp. RC27]